jgi:transposase
VEGTLVPSEERKAQLLNQKGLFIVATNELDADKLPLEEMLRGYKSQVRIERGFRFLKDPQRGPSFWRVRSGPVASFMVMTLCLPVYSALEWRIREGL